MFRVGDRVKHKYGILAGYDGTVKSTQVGNTCEVQFDDPSMGGAIIICAGIELELIPITLPIGNQITFNETVWDEESPSMYAMSKDETAKCTCGGYKTYGTLSVEAHSPWCSIFDTKK